MYFQAFSNLSTGLERLGKLCLLLDHFITSCGKFPDYKYLKYEIGHKIPLLLAKTENVESDRGLSPRFRSDLSGPVHQSIITILSEFATGDRYSNIDLLTSSKPPGDPIGSWFEKVDKPLFDQRVSARAKAQILVRAGFIDATIGSFAAVSHISESGSTISDMFEGSVRTGVQSAVAPYRQLYVLQIVRYWVDILIELHYLARGISNTDIPAFGEVFAIFYNSDSYFRSRRTWDRL
jgi:hypothetical protein